MGYFSNGTEGMDYQETYCFKCKHWSMDGCPVWDLHILFCYDECNNEGSMLHYLIPYIDGVNGQCRMFISLGVWTQEELDEAKKEAEKLAEMFIKEEK